MRGIYLLVSVLFMICACSSDVDEFIDNPDSSENPNPNVPNVPNEPNFPFETLDQTNNNNASNVLSEAPTNVRLDSVVSIRYYKYNPNTNTSNPHSKKLNESKITLGPPPPEPTNRNSTHFVYNELNQLVEIDFFSNNDLPRYIDINKRGEQQIKYYFYYDNNNISECFWQIFYDGIGDVIKFADFSYDTNGNLVEMNKYQNGNYTLNISKENNQLLAQYSNQSVQWTNLYVLDNYNNILKYIALNDINTNFKDYYYPKNIYNPFVNLFSKGFYSFLFVDYFVGYIRPEFEKGLSHYTSGTTNTYNTQFQVNDYGFLEIIQKGSYDDGYRTKYYYSIIN